MRSVEFFRGSTSITRRHQVFIFDFEGALWIFTFTAQYVFEYKPMLVIAILTYQEFSKGLPAYAVP
jgi:hypothetical protein